MIVGLNVNKRDEARAAGQLLYTTGKPCRNNHMAPRYVATGKCTQCRSNQALRLTGKAERTFPREAMVVTVDDPNDRPLVEAYVALLNLRARERVSATVAATRAALGRSDDAAVSNGPPESVTGMMK